MSAYRFRMCHFIFFFLGAGLLFSGSAVFAAEKAGGQPGGQSTQPARQAPGNITMGGTQSWDPFEELSQMQAMMHNFLRGALVDTPLGFGAGAPGAAAAFSPDVDLIETNSEYVLEMDLPGLSKDQIEVRAQGGYLTIRGERRQETEREEQMEQGRYYYQGRSFGAFERTFEIPRNAKPEEIKASYEQGVLHVSMPKREQTEPSARKIEIQ